MQTIQDYDVLRAVQNIEKELDTFRPLLVHGKQRKIELMEKGKTLDEALRPKYNKIMGRLIHDIGEYRKRIEMLEAEREWLLGTSEPVR